ncbi:MAG TPA: PQQ-binding-like beta-propeller repeat protein [Candidatus Solibacter sp.]|nr:PQQ-binding-like beta-propeller repeat protein [Candidatus Solibacter sp.]
MRLKFLTAAIFFIALPCFCQDSAMSDSGTFRGNARHSGVYDGAGVPKFSSLKWKFHTAGMILGSPVSASGMIYVGSTDGNLYALDAETGAQKWKFDAKSRIPSTPAIAGGVVYFTAYDGVLYALDASTGTLKWKFQTGGERRFAGKHLHGVQPAAETMPDPFDVYLSSPVVWNGAVYFGSGDGNVYSLNAASGTLNWKFHTGDIVHASPAIADGALFIGSWDSYFYSIDAATGKEKWKFKTGEDHEIYNQVGVQSSAAVVDGMVYFGCRDAHLYALDEKTGEKKWAFSANGSWVVGSPAVKDGKVYFPTSDSSTFFAADAKSGQILKTMTFNKWFIFSSPAIAGNFAYVGSTQGILVAVDLSSMQQVWSFDTDGSKHRPAGYVKPDGTPDMEVIYRSDFYDDMVTGLNRIMGMGAVFSSPLVFGKTVIVGSADGNLYALM